MPDWLLVPHALKTPTRCVGCMANVCARGLFDTGAEVPGYGRVYVCADCVSQAAVKLGWVEPRVALELREEVREARAANAELLVALARTEGRGTWTFTPAAEYDPSQNRVLDGNGDRLSVTDALVCPDCGGPKGPTSKRCKPCSMNAARAARDKQLAEQAT